MRASGYERATSDWYVEPASTVHALLDVEHFDGLCWDPSCGGGNIPLVFASRGMDCVGSDIADRGFGITGLDFLATDTASHFSDPVNIVTNPPYGLIEPYIRRALAKATGKVAILARLALLEGKARRTFFAETPLARVWVSSSRLSMPPGGTDVSAKGGAIAYAWFVWEHGYTGAPTIGWLP